MLHTMFLVLMFSREWNLWISSWFKDRPSTYHGILSVTLSGKSIQQNLYHKCITWNHPFSKDLQIRQEKWKMISKVKRNSTGVTRRNTNSWTFYKYQKLQLGYVIETKEESNGLVCQVKVQVGEWKTRKQEALKTVFSKVTGSAISCYYLPGDSVHKSWKVISQCCYPPIMFTGVTSPKFIPGKEGYISINNCLSFQ